MKNKFKKSYNTSLLIFILFVVLGCNKKNEYDASFFFPEGKTNGSLPKFVTTYGLAKYGVPINADSLLVSYDNLQRKYLGGVGVTGTITIDNKYIEFKPGLGSSLMGTGFEIFKIPMKDVIAARSETVLLITKAVVVDTKNGEFKFQLSKAKHWYNPFEFDDEDICKLINQSITKS